MTMTTDCAACADERAAGAIFCEACGSTLAPALRCPHCAASGGIGADGYCEQCGMLAGRARDHVEADAGSVAAAVSDRGQRHHRNEDAMWLAASGTDVDVVVCDGVSASFDPDVAAQTAAEVAGRALAGEHTTPGGQTMADGAEPGRMMFMSPEEYARLAKEHVSGAIVAASAAVAELARSGDPRRAVSNPACTIVAAIVRGSYVTFGWVGDSRAYWLPATGPAEQLTEDDSWATHAIALGVDPQVALRDPKAHAITAWLGADAGQVTPRTGAFTADRPGHLVLCSDGLWNYLTDPVAFAAAVRTHLAGATLLGAARALVALANERGGADNITVALIPVQPYDPAARVDPAVKE